MSRFIIPRDAEPAEARAIAADAMASISGVSGELRKKPMRALRKHFRAPTLRKYLSIGTVGDVLRLGIDGLLAMDEVGPGTVVALANAIASASEVDTASLRLDVDLPGHWRERVVQGMWNGMVLVHRVVPEDRLWLEDPWVLGRPEIVDGCVVRMRFDEETEIYNSSQAPRYGFTDDVRDLDELGRIAGIGEPRWLSNQGIAMALERYRSVSFLARRLKPAPAN